MKERRIHLKVEVQREHPKASHSVRCCNLTYSWSRDAKVNDHPQGKSLRIICIKCHTIHYKWTAKDWSPIA